MVRSASLTILFAALSQQAVASEPRRLVVKGSLVAASDAPEKAIALKGFTWWYQDTQKNHMRDFYWPDKNVKQLLPGVNLARLVMNHWHDSGGGDCYSDDSSKGFLTESCLSMFDAVVDGFTSNDIFVIITARAAKAAGDGGDGHTVFTNDAMRNQMISMWKFLARRYNGHSNIAGFEVMSEPRTDNIDGCVHKFHQDACAAVWSEDPKAVCFIGPAKFYNRQHLGPEYILEGGPVIYAANFFVPSPWVTTKNPKVNYGDRVPCCDVGGPKDCPKGCDEEITLDSSYLRAQLANIDAFQAKHDVPMWIDQWGVHAEVGKKNQRAYLQDVLAIFEEKTYHWSYWYFRDQYGPPHCPGGYEIFCHLNETSLVRNTIAIDELRKHLEVPSEPLAV
jgi:hypothetical protein